ncbi:MAG: transposase [Gammaproteobacteria bacterium]
MLDAQITVLEQTVLQQSKLAECYRSLLSISGIGQMPALSILFEIGTIERFKTVGRFNAYCCCVGSRKLSNGKRTVEIARPNRQWGRFETTISVGQAVQPT